MFKMRSIIPASAGLAAFFASLGAAMPWLEPVQTPVGLMAAVGFSPLPTEAPGFGSIPKELLRKQNQVPYPPPANWCGFVGGNPSDVLSCSVIKTCVYSGAVLGCCDAGLIQTCTNLFTTCSDYGDTCNSACQANYNILKCPNARPYCGTFAFNAGTRLYNCDTTQGAAKSVEFLNDYYLTAIGSQIRSSSFGPISITASNQVLSSYSRLATASSRSGTPISNGPVQTNPPSSNAVADPNSTSHSGISTGAVIGIVVGIVIVILAILAALITWCCIRRRRQRPAPAPAPAPPPQMQQQHQTQPQPNPPQAPTYPPQQPTYPPQQPTYPPTQQGYFNPPASDPIKPTFNNNTSTLPIPEADSTTTTPIPAGAVAYNDTKHDNPTAGPPRYSVANGGAQTPPPHLHGNPQIVGGGLAPNPDVPGAGTGDYHNQYPHPPQSPALTEVEGSSLYGHGQGQGQGVGQGQRPGMGHGYSQGSGTISPLAAGGTSMVGQNMGTGYGQGSGHGAHEVDGYGRLGNGVGTGVGVGGQGQGQGQGGYGGGVYEIGEGERRR